MLRLISLLFLVILLAACSATVRYQKNKVEQAEKEVVSDIEPGIDDAEVLETQTGVASFYADKYNGLPTYSGEIYDMNGLSAAHPSYRMGTIVRVTNLYNKK
ncbi:MAG: hypothetical protein A3J88_08620, partial [Melioribacter sp. RIFOXYB12_FULL_38_5]